MMGNQRKISPNCTDMNDQAFCRGGDCPLKNNCWRYIQGMGVPPMFAWYEEPGYDKKTKICELYLGN